MDEKGDADMMNTLVLRHDTGAKILLKSETPAMVTKLKCNAVLISVGVSPIASTPVKVAALTKVA